MREGHGQLLNKWAGIGNTWLFMAVLAFMVYLVTAQEYMACLCVVGIGIYAELWNMRVSQSNKHAVDMQKLHLCLKAERLHAQEHVRPFVE